MDKHGNVDFYKKINSNVLRTSKLNTPNKEDIMGLKMKKEILEENYCSHTQKDGTYRKITSRENIDLSLNIPIPSFFDEKSYGNEGNGNIGGVLPHAFFLLLKGTIILLNPIFSFFNSPLIEETSEKISHVCEACQKAS